MKMEFTYQSEVLHELKTLRKLRLAVSKMVHHVNQGDEHPIDMQRVSLFLAEAEKANRRTLVLLGVEPDYI
jgi:hypothetical protein